MVTLIKSYSSLVRKRRKQLSETKSLYTTVRDHIKQFELKKFARRANINVSKITSKNPATWLGLSKSDKELNKQKRESVNQRYTAAQISGQEPKWAQYRFEAAPKSTPPPGKELYSQTYFPYKLPYLLSRSTNKYSSYQNHLNTGPKHFLTVTSQK